MKRCLAIRDSSTVTSKPKEKILQAFIICSFIPTHDLIAGVLSTVTLVHIIAVDCGVASVSVLEHGLNVAVDVSIETLKMFSE